MSALGRWCAVAAVMLAATTVAVWDDGAPQVSGGAGLAGHELFQAKGCAGCHDGPDSTALVGGFPSLIGADGWAGDRRPGMSADEYLTESIVEPSAFVSPAFTGGVGPTNGMPNLTLTPDEADELVAYLLSG